MRELSPTLLAAQKAAPPINALAKLVLTYDSNTVTYTESRILDIKETGDGPLQSLAVILDNSDKTLTSIDLQGYEGVLSYGAGKEYSAIVPMKVIAQEFDSNPNKLTCTLSLVGICSLMAEDKATGSYMPDEDDDKSVKTLVNYLLAGSLAGFTSCVSHGVVWEDGYDELADTFKPRDSFRVYEGNNRLSKLNQLLGYTRNVALPKADGKIHIFKPKTSGDPDYIYSLLEPEHTFFAKSLRNRLVMPNRILVRSQVDDLPYYEGEAIDTESYDKLPKFESHRMRLESDEQAGDIAEAILAKVRMWCEAGSTSVPMNIGQEAYDYVLVVDPREKDERAGNVGRFTRHYNVTKNEWELRITFGDWQNVRKALANLGITSDDLENYFSRFQAKDAYIENLLAKNMGFYWLDPDNTIDLSKIGDNLDNLPDGEQYVRTSTWNMKLDEDPESPTYGLFVLNMDEHTIYQPGYDPNEKRRTFTATPTTPYDVGDLWLDAATVKRCITARASGAYVAGDWIATTLDAIENGDVFSRVKSMALSAAGLVMMDQVIEGTYGKIKSMALNANGLVLMDNTIEGTYGKIKSAALSASGLVVMDQVVDGTYGKLKTTDISAGHILLSSYTQVSGEWYDEAGVEIDANYGINIYGKNNALTTRATKTGTIQCYVGSDGKIYAGAGNVQLSSEGIRIYGENLRFYYGTTYSGFIKPVNDGIQIGNTSGTKRVRIVATSDIVIDSNLNISLYTGPGYGILADGCDFMDLPRKTSAPTGVEGRMVYNPATGYLNVYSSGAWWHANRDAGWA